MLHTADWWWLCNNINPQSNNFHIKKICAVDIDLNATMPNYDIEIVAFAVIADAKMGHTRGHNNAQLECVILMLLYFCIFIIVPFRPIS